MGAGILCGLLSPEPKQTVETKPEPEEEVRQAVSVISCETPDSEQEIPEPEVVVSLKAWHEGELPGDLVLLSSKIKKWVQENPQLAFEEIQKLKDLRPDIYFFALRIVAEEWGKQDPETMLTASEGLTHSFAKHLFLLHGMTGCVHKDPDFAFSWLRKNPYVDQNNSFTFQLLCEMGTINPQEACKHATDLHAGISVQKSIAINFVETSPDEAFEWATAMPSGKQKAQIVGAVLEQMAFLHPQKAIQYISQFPEDIHPVYADQIRQRIVMGLSETHPEQAAEILKGINTPSEYNLAATTLAGKWGATDYEAAREWVFSLADPRTRFDAEKALLAGAAWRDPAKAVELVQKINVTSETSDISNFMAEQWARIDPQAATQWMMELAQKDISARALPETLQTWAHSDPESAIKFVQSNAANFTEPRLIPAFFKQLAIENPESAYQTALSMQNFVDRNSAVTEVLKNLSVKNPSKTKEMLESITNQEVRDESTMYLVTEIAKLDPMEAFQYAQKVEDPTFRYQSIMAIVPVVNEYDSALALKLIDEADLPPDQKQIAYQTMQ